MTKAKIIGSGSYFPKKILTNKDLEKFVETTDEWIKSRTGICERRIADTKESSSTMGYYSALEAIKDANLTEKEIDFIIVATLTPDYIFPSTACLIQSKLKINNIPALDIQAACSGYIYALSIAKNFVESNSYKNVLIVAAEKLSSIVDYTDRATCVLFGDAAAAAVISKKGKGLEIEKTYLASDGSLSDLLILPAGGSKNPSSNSTIANNMHYIKMEGKEVFKHAVRRMLEAIYKCLEIANLTEKDISWLIPHQANQRIIEAIAKRFKHLPEDKVYVDVVKAFGNTSASSIGLALDLLKKKNKFTNGEKIMLTAFGAGFTWGSAILNVDL